MTRGLAKSDLAIATVKPTPRRVSALAELAEPRVGG
jgi:hypothetical protein